MTIFRHKLDGKLYKIYDVKRTSCICGKCGKGLQAYGLYGNTEQRKVESLDEFEVVAVYGCVV